MSQCKACQDEITSLTSQLLENFCVNCFKQDIIVKCKNDDKRHKRKARFATKNLQLGKLTKQQKEERTLLWDEILDFFNSFKTYTGTATEKSVLAFLKQNQPFPSEEFLMDLESDDWDNWNENYREQMDYITAFPDNKFIDLLLGSISSATDCSILQEVTDILMLKGICKSKLSEKIREKIKSDNGYALNELFDIATGIKDNISIEILQNRLFSEELFSLEQKEEFSPWSIIYSLLLYYTDKSCDDSKLEKFYQLMTKYRLEKSSYNLNILSVLVERLEFQPAKEKCDEIIGEKAHALEELKKLGVNL